MPTTAADGQRRLTGMVAVLAGALLLFEAAALWMWPSGQSTLPRPYPDTLQPLAGLVETLAGTDGVRLAETRTSTGGRILTVLLDESHSDDLGDIRSILLTASGLDLEAGDRLDLRVVAFGNEALFGVAPIAGIRFGGLCILAVCAFALYRNGARAGAPVAGHQPIASGALVVADGPTGALTQPPRDVLMTAANYAANDPEGVARTLHRWINPDKPS